MRRSYSKGFNTEIRNTQNTESEQTLVFITSNVSAVVRICSGKGCTLYPCTLNILEVVVSQTEINTEVRFGNMRKYISSLSYSSYRTYSLL